MTLLLETAPLQVKSVFSSIDKVCHYESCPADGSDYTAVTRTLTFAPGVTQMNVPVDTIDDSTAEDDEDFEAVLTNPSSLLTLGSQDVATVTIEDNESKY